MPAKSRTASLKEAGRPVARVGDEIITRHELIAAVRETIDRHPAASQLNSTTAAPSFRRPRRSICCTVKSSAT